MTAGYRWTCLSDNPPGEMPWLKKPLLVYAAAYETVDAALADLDAIEQAHKDEVIGQTTRP